MRLHRVFALLAHRRTIKPLAILLTVVSAAATYFIAKYNVAIDSSMVLNTIHTDTTEVGQLLSVQMIPYVLFLIVLPVLIILSLDITFKASGKYLFASAGLIGATLSIAVGSLYANYNAIHRAGNVSNKYIVYSLVPINIISSTVSVVSKSLRPYLRSGKKDAEISAHVSPHPITWWSCWRSVSRPEERTSVSTGMAAPKRIPCCGRPTASIC